VDSVNDVGINYGSQPFRKGTLRAPTPWTADADFVATVKP